MSHFTLIKTKIKDRDVLEEALFLMGHEVKLDQELKNPHDHKHPTVNVEVAVGTDIGFKWNEVTQSYELVTDLQTWNQPVPVERFLQKLSQQYSRMALHKVVKEEGFEVQEEWEMEDNSIELTVTRWT